MISLKTETIRRSIEHQLGPIQANLILELLKKSIGSTESYSADPAITLNISINIPMGGYTEKIALSNERIHNLVIKESFTHNFTDLPEKLLEEH